MAILHVDVYNGMFLSPLSAFRWVPDVDQLRCCIVQHMLVVQSVHLVFDDTFHPLHFVLRVGFQDHRFLLINVVEEVFACYWVQHTLEDV